MIIKIFPLNFFLSFFSVFKKMDTKSLREHLLGYLSSYRAVAKKVDPIPLTIRNVTVKKDNDTSFSEALLEITDSVCEIFLNNFPRGESVFDVVFEDVTDGPAFTSALHEIFDDHNHSRVNILMDWGQYEKASNKYHVHIHIHPKKKKNDLQ